MLAGIYGRSQATTRMTNDAGIATAAVGGYVIKSGLEMKQKKQPLTMSQLLRWESL